LQPKEIEMGALLSFAYGVVVYVLSLATSLYAIGFVANLFVPKSIDTGATGPIGPALATDLLLLGVFAIQHSVMARRSFKAWWTRIVSPVVERSTFVLASAGALALLLWQWRPIAEPVVWHLHDALTVNLVWAVFWLGWAVMLASTFLINHFEFFGVSQVAANLSGSKPSASEFRTPLFYRYVRHPLYLGLLLGFWATPRMTAGHLLFAIGCTGYIMVGIWFEERDLVAQFGERYLRYRRQVGMLLPSRRAS
jgi:protein-S-isoprenylcysteine O-methyltransferase Ste14